MISLLNNRDKVLALVTDHLEGKVTNSRLQTISNSYPYDITKMLHDLEENKFLIAEGYGKGTVYYINHDFLAENSINIDINQNEEKIIEFIKKNGFISNKLSREKLGFTKGKSTELFKSLLLKGLIVSCGIGKGTTYKLKV